MSKSVIYPYPTLPNGEFILSLSQQVPDDVLVATAEDSFVVVELCYV